MFKITLLAVATVAALALVASLTGSAIAAETKSDALNGTELRQAVSGKTVYLKISGFELPIRYSASGTMAGSLGTIAASLARGDGVRIRSRQMVDLRRSALPALDELDGRQVLLLQAHP